MEGGNGFARLEEKKRQMIDHCSLPVERLAVIVGFEGPSIVAGKP
jgi:hypothetical protein